MKKMSLKFVNELINKDYESLKALKLNDISTLIIEYLEKENGERLAYIPEENIFRYYQNGVWKKQENEGYYIKKIIRNILSNLNKKNSKYHINKVYDDLCFEKGDFRNKSKFADHRQNNNYINFKNGMLNLNTMELAAHNPKYHSIFQLPHKYDSDAKCPKWEKTLKDWIPEDDTINFLQEYVGYLLIPDNSAQLFPILYGSGANGKSVFIDIIKTILGENISNIGLSQFSGSGSRWTPAHLQGNLANICGDIDPKYLKEQGLIKSILGQDQITVEKKFQHPYEFQPVTRLLFSANELPKSRDKSFGWYRRLEIVRFPNRFIPGTKGFDPNKKQKLKKELPGIINWAVEGLLRFIESGFTKSKQMIKDKKMYISTNDPISIFIHENYELVEDKDERIPTHIVYEKYKEWAEENGYNVENKGILTQHLGKKGVEAKNKSYNSEIYRHYLGIKEKESIIEDELELVIDLNKYKDVMENEKAIVVNNGPKIKLLN